MRIIGLEATYEPVVVASARLAARWPGFRGGLIPASSIHKREILGEEVTILGRLAPIAIVREGAATVVGSIFTGSGSQEGDSRVVLGGFDPALVETWRRSRLTIRSTGDMVIFPRSAPEEAVPVPLARGEHDIYRGRGRREVALFPNLSVQVEYHVVALGERPEITRPCPPDLHAPPVVATRELERIAEGPDFLHAPHGPMILLPASLLADWEGEPRGAQKGPHPYREARRVRDAGVIEVDGRDALVIDPHQAVGLRPRPDGLLLVAWQGAASERSVVVGGLTIPEDFWQPVGTFRARERELVMFDSIVAGRKLEPWDRVEGVLPSTGTYDVAHVRFYGVAVKFGDAIETANLAATRLRLRR